jgi:hypothetical protein
MYYLTKPVDLQEYYSLMFVTEKCFSKTMHETRKTDQTDESQPVQKNEKKPMDRTTQLTPNCTNKSVVQY